MVALLFPDITGCRSSIHFPLCFIRRCIEWSISEKQASCPICLLPAWAKDVKSDRQIGTVIGCVSSMDSHILQGDDMEVLFLIL